MGNIYNFVMHLFSLMIIIKIQGNFHFFSFECVTFIAEARQLQKH